MKALWVLSGFALLLGCGVSAWAGPAHDLAALKARLGPVAPDADPTLSHLNLQTTTRRHGPDRYAPLSSELRYELYMYQKMCDRHAFDRDDLGDDARSFVDTLRDIERERPDLLRGQDLKCGVVLLQKFGSSSDDDPSDGRE